jgi:hypothetical protein
MRVARSHGPAVGSHGSVSQHLQRSAFDFTGPEYTEESPRSLSADVRSEDRAEIEAAWRAGDYTRAAGVAASLADIDDRRQVLLPLMAEWVRSAPEEAAQFAQTSPAGVERREMLETVIRGWSKYDVAAASAWLNALEPDPDQDAAVAAIATNEILMKSRPEIALSWAESLAAPDIRWEVICTVVEEWARVDQLAARRYIENASVLTSGERSRMLTHVFQQSAFRE